MAHRAMAYHGSPGMWLTMAHRACGLSWLTRHVAHHGSPGMWLIILKLTAFIAVIGWLVYMHKWTESLLSMVNFPDFGACRSCITSY